MGRPKTNKSSNTELRKRVFELCETLGFWNVHCKAVGEKLGTAHQNVSRWKHQFIEKFGVPNVEKYKKEMNVHSQTAMREIVKLIKDNDKNIRLKAIKLLGDFGHNFDTFLERHGLKKKIPDQIETKEVPYDMAAAYKRFKDDENEKKELLEEQAHGDK